MLKSIVTLFSAIFPAAKPRARAAAHAVLFAALLAAPIGAFAQTKTLGLHVAPATGVIAAKGGTLTIAPYFPTTADRPSGVTRLLVVQQQYGGIYPTAQAADAVPEVDYRLTDPAGVRPSWVTISPDGTVSPSTLTVTRSRQRNFAGAKTAVIRFIAFSGDKSYNAKTTTRILNTTSTAGDVTVTLGTDAVPARQAEPDHRQIELYLVSVAEGDAESPSFLPGGKPTARLDRFAVLDRRHVAYEARIINSVTGEMVDAAADIILRLQPLPPNLASNAKLGDTLVVRNEYQKNAEGFWTDSNGVVITTNLDDRVVTGTTTYHLSANPDTANRLTLRDAPATLTIPAGESAARSAGFDVLPLVPGKYELPAPVVVADVAVTKESLLANNQHYFPNCEVTVAADGTVTLAATGCGDRDSPPDTPGNTDPNRLYRGTGDNKNPFTFPVVPNPVAPEQASELTTTVQLPVKDALPTVGASILAVLHVSDPADPPPAAATVTLSLPAIQQFSEDVTTTTDSGSGASTTRVLPSVGARPNLIDVRLRLNIADVTANCEDQTATVGGASVTGKTGETCVDGRQLLRSNFPKHHVAEITIDAGGGVSARPEDFLVPDASGNLVPATAFPVKYMQSLNLTGIQGNADERWWAPIHVRNDGVVESEESFQYTVRPIARPGYTFDPASVTANFVLRNNGTAELKISVIDVNGGSSIAQDDPVIINAVLLPSAGNTAVNVDDVGGSLVYTSTQTIARVSGVNVKRSIVFTDTTGVGGTGPADGMLSDDEMRATIEYNATPNNIVFNTPRSELLPSNTVQSSAAAPNSRVVTIADAATALAIPESGAYARMTLSLSSTVTALRTAPAGGLVVGMEVVPGDTADFTGTFADLQGARSWDVLIPAGASQADFTLPALIINDQITEPDESFKIRISPEIPVQVDSAGTASTLYTIGEGRERTVTIKDDDIAEFSVEPKNAGQTARYGESYRVVGRLSRALQVSCQGEECLTISTGAGTAEYAPFDSDEDGFLRGDELTESFTITIPIANSSNLKLLHIHNFMANPPSGLSAANFAFPVSADPGRIGKRNVDLVIPIEKIAPQFNSGICVAGGADSTPVTRDEDCTPANKITHDESSLGEDTARSVVYVKLSHDPSVTATALVTARYAHPEGMRAVEKSVTFTGSGDATTPVGVTFEHADFTTLGVTNDDLLNAPKVVTTEVTLDESTRQATVTTVPIFAGVTVPGPQIVFEDDESRRAVVRVFLTDETGSVVRDLEAENRRDLFVRAELRDVTVVPGANADDAATAKDETLDTTELGALLRTAERITFGVSVTPRGSVTYTYPAEYSEERGGGAHPKAGTFEVSAGATGLSLADLGNPDLPRMLSIAPGASSAQSAAVRVTPGKTGVFRLRADSASPQNFAHLARRNYWLTHAVTPAPASAAPRFLVTLDDLAVEVAEGDTGVTAGVTVRNANTEHAAAFSVGGVEEILVVNYEIAALASGGGDFEAADLSAAPGAGSLTFAAGESSGAIALPNIADDSDSETAEKFALRLLSVARIVSNTEVLPVHGGVQLAAVGFSQSQAVYTIAANDGGETAPVTAPATAPRLLATPLVVLKEAPGEGETDAVRHGGITLTRPSGFSGEIRGTLRTVDGGNAEPQDYAMERAFTIAAGDNTATAFISANADGVTEQHESFEVEIRISEPAASLLPPADNTRVEIRDANRPQTMWIEGTASVPGVSVSEGQVGEIEVQLRPATFTPLANPLYFTLTPTFSTTSPADFLVRACDANGANCVTRPGESVEEVTLHGVISPGESSAKVGFLIAADGDAEPEERAVFALTFTDLGDAAANAQNTHDGGVSINTSVATVLIAASTASDKDVLVITKTGESHTYDGAAPAIDLTEYTVAPQAGSDFATGDTGDTDFFTESPLELALGDGEDGTEAGVYRFRLKSAPAYAAGIEAKYDFVVSADSVFTIEPKEVTLSVTGASKVYDGTAYALNYGKAGKERGFSDPGDFTGLVEADEDDVYAFGGVYPTKDVSSTVVTGFALGGAQAHNYTLAAASEVTGAITTAPIDHESVKFTLTVGDTTLGSGNKNVNAFVQRDQITASGVVESELADFRNGGLVFSANVGSISAGAYGTIIDVPVTIKGDCADPDGGANIACGLTDHGAFKASNYSLSGTAPVTVTAKQLLASNPGTPGSVVVHATGFPGQARVTWNAVTDAGYPGGAVQEYRVLWQAAGVGGGAPGAFLNPGAAGTTFSAADLATPPATVAPYGELVAATETGYTITALEFNVDYNVMVFAVSRYATSARGETSFSILDRNLIPPAPKLLALERTGTDATAVNAKFDGAREIQGVTVNYIARVRHAARVRPVGKTFAHDPPTAWVEIRRNTILAVSSPLVTPRTASLAEASFSGFTFLDATDPGQKRLLEVQLAAQTQFGVRSGWSESRMILPGSATEAPASMEVAAPNQRVFAGDGAVDIEIHWLAPLNSAPVTSYVVQWAEGADATAAESAAFGTTNQVVVGGNVYSHVLRGLDSTKVYKAQVAAGNANGLGAFGRAIADSGGGSGGGGSPALSRTFSPNNAHDHPRIYLNSLVPVVDAPQVMDGGLKIRWRPAVYGDGTLNTQGAKFTEARIRWREAPLGDWNAPAGLVVDLSGVLTNGEFDASGVVARNEYDITGLQNGTTYEVDFWLVPDVSQAPVGGGGERAWEPHLLGFLENGASGSFNGFDGITAAPAERTVTLPGGGTVTVGFRMVDPDGAGPLPPAPAPTRTRNSLLDYTVKVRHTGVPAAPLQLPDAPALSAPTLGANTGVVSIRAAWAAPAGDATVTAYELQWRPRAGAGAQAQNWQTASVGADVTAHTITAYKRPGVLDTTLQRVEYEIRARAQSADGWGAWAAAQTFTPPALSALSLAVTDGAGTSQRAVTLRPVAFSSGVLSYAGNISARKSETYAAPVASQLFITPTAGATSGIRVSLPGDLASAQDVNSGATTSNAIALPPAQAVDVHIEVTDDSASLTYQLRLTRIAAPSAPLLRAVPGDDTAKLTWSEPAQSGGDDNYQEYHVRWRAAEVASVAGDDSAQTAPQTGRLPGGWLPNPADSAQGEGWRTVKGDVSQLEIDGLSAGTRYEFEVRTVNSGGVSVWSRAVMVTPLQLTLDVVGNAGAAPDGDDAIIIARYLLGVRGDPLVENVAGVDASAVSTNALVRLQGGGEIDVDNDGVTTAADIIMLTRYLLGVRGASVTQGQTDEPHAGVTARIAALPGAPAP